MNLIISNLEIPFDSEGRMSLNALHKASGGEDRHKPIEWLRLKSTKELISIYQSRNSHFEPVNTIRGGNNSGTFAIWESAGKPDNKQPSQWLRNKSTKEYIEFLRQNANLHFDPINVVQGGY